MEFREQQIHRENSGNPLKWGRKSGVSNERMAGHGGTGCELIAKAPS